MGRPLTALTDTNRTDIQATSPKRFSPPSHVPNGLPPPGVPVGLAPFTYSRTSSEIAAAEMLSYHESCERIRSEIQAMGRTDTSSSAEPIAPAPQQPARCFQLPSCVREGVSRLGKAWNLYRSIENRLAPFKTPDDTQDNVEEQPVLSTIRLQGDEFAISERAQTLPEVSTRPWSLDLNLT